MSAEEGKPDASIADVFKSLTETLTKAQQAEAARRAALKPEQRLAEDQAKEARTALAQREDALRRLAKCGDAIRQNETWTIERFAWLLAAEDPDNLQGWSFFGPFRNQDQQQHFVSVLESCTDASLKPLNRQDAPTKWRFRTESLLEVAKEKHLGHFDLIAEMRGARQPKPAAQVKTLPQKGTESRERQSIERRRDLAEFAKELAESGQGTIAPTRITLAIHGVTLNEKFRARHPRWQNTADKTFESDRRACKPRIDVLTGRPKAKPENPL